MFSLSVGIVGSLIFLFYEQNVLPRAADIERNGDGPKTIPGSRFRG